MCNRATRRIVGIISLTLFICAQALAGNDHGHAIPNLVQHYAIDGKSGRDQLEHYYCLGPRRQKEGGGHYVKCQAKRKGARLHDNLFCTTEPNGTCVAKRPEKL